MPFWHKWLQKWQHFLLDYIHTFAIIKITFWHSTYFKTKVVNENFGWISFMVNDIDIHQLNLGPFRNFKNLHEISFNFFFFLYFCSNICVMSFCYRKKSLAYEKGGDLINEHCNFIIIIIICVIMFHQS